MSACVFAYVASDAGPRATLKALAALLPGVWLKATGHREWCDVLSASEADVLFCGTSDSPSGRASESAARVAAHALGIPCVAIEDFPGSFVAVPGGPVRMLIVDSEFAAGLARSKMADDRTAVEICPAVRYDPLRRRLSELRRESASWDAVLWVGQPETGDSRATLELLYPEIQNHGAAVWFRAHPRDAGYGDGAYGGLLANAEDVSQCSLDACLARRPRLVITQFSSVGIEAGFWGIPVLNAVFSGIGGATLLSKKGYAVPPWCEAGAAFLVTEPAAIAQTLHAALRSEAARRRVMQGFDVWFSVREEAGPRLVKLLYNQGLFQRHRSR